MTTEYSSKLNLNLPRTFNNHSSRSQQTIENLELHDQQLLDALINIAAYISLLEARIKILEEV